MLLVCRKFIFVLKEYNIKCLYNSKHNVKHGTLLEKLRKILIKKKFTESSNLRTNDLKKKK